ncbi:MAG: tetratricopeptide repeat protein [Candidatus Obscuribacterales bacterium]|nr:tetratricopeptide repeat protein [Candidatus Obscuribacterales bacterium]
MQRWLGLLLACAVILPVSTFAEGFSKPVPPFKLGAPQSPSQLQEIYKSLKIKISESPGNTENLIQLAEVESELGDIDQGLKHARSAANIASEDWRAHAILAKLLLLDRNALAARLQAERALELTKNKSNREAIVSILVPALLELKNYESADKVSRQELKRSPQSPVLAFCRAFALSEPKDSRERSVTAYKQAIALKPGFQEAHYNLALLLAESGQPAEAINELKICLKSSSGSQLSKAAEELISKLAHQD